MKIAFDSQIFLQQKYGGISRYFTELIRALGSDSNIAPKLVLPVCTNAFGKTLPPSLKFGINLPHLPIAQRYVNFVARKASSRIIRIMAPDIVHETYYPYGEPRPYRHSKTVTTVHDMIHELFAKDFPPVDRTAEFKRRAVQRADHVICVSENTRQDLIRIYGIDEQKTSVVHLGVDHFSYDGEIEDEPKLPPYLLYVGLRNSYKNFENVLKAYGNSVHLKEGFSLVCFGGGMFTESELNQARSLGIPENKLIYCHGNDNILKGLYQNASAFIYPSIYEGFGIPPLEAMQQRCPVVSSNRGSLPEVLGEAAEYFDPFDIEQIRCAIERVVSDTICADGLREGGVNRVKGFTWKKCASSTLKVYESVIG